jgi:hypothetical protein
VRARARHTPMQTPEALLAAPSPRAPQARLLAEMEDTEAPVEASAGTEAPAQSAVQR